MRKSKPIEDLENRQRRASATKILRTRTRALHALDELLKRQPAAKIRLATICREAGVSTDSIYKPHHADLRETLEKKLRSAISAQAEVSVRRRHYITATADERISQLEKENEELKGRQTDLYQALNVLAQLVEELPQDDPSARKVVRLQPRPRKKGA